MSRTLGERCIWWVPWSVAALTPTIESCHAQWASHEHSDLNVTNSRGTRYLMGILGCCHTCAVCCRPSTAKASPYTAGTLQCALQRGAWCGSVVQCVALAPYAAAPQGRQVIIPQVHCSVCCSVEQCCAVCCTCTVFCDMTHAYVWHDFFIRVVSLNHTRDVSDWYVWYDSFTRVTRLIHIDDTTQSYVRHNSFIRVT